MRFVRLRRPSEASFKRNAKFAVVSSLTTLLVNASLLGILPRLLSVEAYGFLQLYLLYSTFVGLAHLGLVDGVYLELGGMRLKAVDRRALTSLAVLLVIFQFAMAGAVWALSGMFAASPIEEGVWKAVAICVILTNVRFFFLYILQATASAAQATACIMVDRLSYLGLVFVASLANDLTLESAILFDLVSKALSLCVAVYFCRGIFTTKFISVRNAARASLTYIRAGVQLLLANLASSFIMGAARLGVERAWSVAEFAFVSLALGITLVGITLVQSVGNALFPFLRRIRSADLPKYYQVVRVALSPILMIPLIGYIPMSVLLPLLLPKYAESVVYLGILLPIVMFEGLLVLLAGQMMKSLRLETLLLALNFCTLCAGVLFTFVGSSLIHRIEAVLVGLVIVLAARSMVADFIVTRFLGIKAAKIIYLELFLACGFIIEMLWGVKSDWPPIISTLLICSYVFPGIVKSLRVWRSGKVGTSPDLSI